MFRTKGGLPFINETWEAELYKYLAGIIKRLNGFVIAINGMPYHVHVLISLAPCDLPSFMRDLKASSSKWAKKYSPKFSWQRRYAAFTVSESVVPAVKKYIQDQKEHHKRSTFESEYIAMLKKHNIDFEEKYLWE